jgi:protein-disulfide isomerase
VRRGSLQYLVTIAVASVLTISLALPGFSQQSARAAEPEITKGHGTRSAPVVVEVFSDFQCPACRELYQSTLKPLMANYVASGKVYLVHRDMPLSIHSHSRQAARFANAAAAIGKLDRVSDVLYSTQDVWGVNGNVEAVVAQVLTPAEMRRVRELAASEPVNASIDRDLERGRSLQVRSTPSVFVTHRGRTQPLPPGGVNYPLLKQYIDHLLRQP